ncbi:MAG: tetratricopeptide repeat protein [Oligoflexales bacterium]
MNDHQINLSNCLERVEKAANSGLRYAMWKLGNFYFEGRYVKQDYEQAAAWYKKASDLGLYIGHRSYGELLFNGIGGIQDQEKALRLFKLSAQTGDPRSCFLLGKAYLLGQGCKQKRKEAELWLQKASLLDHEEAKLHLAFLNATGLILGLNPGENFYRLNHEIKNGNTLASYAEYLLSKHYNFETELDSNLKELGLPDAEYEYCMRKLQELGGDDSDLNLKAELDANLKRLSYQGYLPAIVAQIQRYRFGDGVTQDLQIIKEYARLAAGFKQAIARYAVLEGNVVDHGHKPLFMARQHLKNARRGCYVSQIMAAQYLTCSKATPNKTHINLLRKGAELGSNTCMMELGKLGFDKNPFLMENEGVFWLQMAADEGYTDGHVYLAECLFFGVGCEKNIEESLVYYHNAQEMGSYYASLSLGKIFFHGTGCIRNFKAAKNYFSIAAKNGCKESESILKEWCLEYDLEDDELDIFDDGTTENSKLSDFEAVNNDFSKKRCVVVPIYKPS